MEQHGKTIAFNRVASAAVMSILFIAIAWFAGFSRAHADGGTVQFE